MREVATSGFTARSSAVNTAITPGAARATSQSIDTTRACACSLRRNATCSAFDVCRSSTKLPRPVSRRGSSVRFTRAPMIFGRTPRTSLIGVGALAQRLPLRVIMAADDRRAARLDAADFGEGSVERVVVLNVLGMHAGMETDPQRHGVGGKQKCTILLKLHPRADRSWRMARQ